MSVYPETIAVILNYRNVFFSAARGWPVVTDHGRGQRYSLGHEFNRWVATPPAGLMLVHSIRLDRFTD